MNLQQQLDKLTQDIVTHSPLKIVENIQIGFKEMIDRQLDSNALKKGDFTPNFSLPNATNLIINLEEELKKGTVVLSFYRGGWCPFCSVQLRAYQQILDKIESFGASLIAISPELPDNSLSTKEKNELDFEVLSDETPRRRYAKRYPLGQAQGNAHQDSDRGNTVAKIYGLAFITPEAHQQAHRDLDLLLPEINGDESWSIPLTATYIIDRVRKIIWSHTNPNYRLRADPSEILEVLANRGRAAI